MIENRRKHAVSKYMASTAIGLSLMVSAPSIAQEDGEDVTIEEVIVTASRRSAGIQETPLNIAAVGGSQIEEQGFSELADMMSYIPGINIVDGGGRQGNPIIVRGLNAQGLGSNDGNNSFGGTVATYLGEIPVYVDLQLNDLQRVEVLLGPQGTLYGAGTLGGAIRYIPNKPDFSGNSFSVRGEGSSMAKASGLGYSAGMTANFAVSDTFALRASMDYTHDTGFIDYVNVVKEPGVSDPDPFDAGESISDNIMTVEDADGEKILSGRIAARFMPNDTIDASLTYYYQKAEIEGRRTSHYRDNVPFVGRYESAFRVLEPNTIENDLLALEVTADLGFAELTSATGYSTFADDGQRDQTTLLITLEYSYELFPNFTSFTHEVGQEERINQEIRLVSKTEGPLQWIVGGYFNKLNSWGSSSEFTPNYDTYAINELGFDFLVDRPDDLEYFSQSHTQVEEYAAFGEVSYDISDQLTVTVGGRYYDYKVQVYNPGAAFPLFDLDFVPTTLDEIKAGEFDPDLGAADNGFLFKANISYQVSDDMLAYFTVSEGYRIGGNNGVSPCSDYDPDGDNLQGACALANGQQYDDNSFSTRDERGYGPDTTRNYELGIKSTLMDGSLVLNGAIYLVKWNDPQLGSATINANIPITVNAEGAESKGIELSANYRATEKLTIRGSFSYTNSELTADAPGLIRTITPPGYGSAFEDGQAGDRLPGSPETQFAAFASWVEPIGDADLIFNAGLSYQGDVLTRAGGRGDSLTLDAYTTVDTSINYKTDTYTVTLFAKNLTNTFAETSAVGTVLNSQVVTDNDGGNVYPRAYRTIILPPRQVGVRFTYNF